MADPQTSRPDPFGLDFKPANRIPPPRGGSASIPTQTSSAFLTGTQKPVFPPSPEPEPDPVGGSSWAPWTPPQSSSPEMPDTPVGEGTTETTQKSNSLPIGPIVAVVALAIFIPMLVRK